MAHRPPRIVTAEDISIIIPVKDAQEDTQRFLKMITPFETDIKVLSEGSRARSLNKGAALSDRRFLWFLHVDSALDEQAFKMLLKALEEKPQCLHYFKLKFADDGPKHVKWNAVGANLRSKIFGTPFGDQGLCIRKDLFFKTGGFDESAKIGEDHLFVWRARRHNIPLNQVDASITTSARTYQKNGWLKTTLHHQKVWISQAIPEFINLILKR